jgi:Holliday junction resolvasome RuvABC endonuclease subunit
MSHGKMIGVIEAAAEYKDILVIEVQDSTCKKVVLGKGNAKKADIALFYKDQYPEIESEHILDCVMFCHYYLIATNKKKPNTKCQKKIITKSLNQKKD